MTPLHLPHGNIKCGTAPVFNRVHLGKVVSNKWGDLEKVVGSNPGGQEGLVSISETRTVRFHEKWSREKSAQVKK